MSAEEPLVIDLDYHDSDCAVCGEPAHPRLGVPMYEGQMVGPDAVEWGGFPACERCHRRWEEEFAAPVCRTSQRNGNSHGS